MNLFKNVITCCVAYAAMACAATDSVAHRFLYSDFMNRKIVYVDEEKEIAPGLTLYNRPDAVKVMDFGSCGLNVVQDGVMQPEDFRHEQYLLAEEVFFDDISVFLSIDLIRGLARKRRNAFMKNLLLSREYPLRRRHA